MIQLESATVSFSSSKANKTPLLFFSKAELKNYFTFFDILCTKKSPVQDFYLDYSLVTAPSSDLESRQNIATSTDLNIEPSSSQPQFECEHKGKFGLYGIREQGIQTNIDSIKFINRKSNFLCKLFIGKRLPKTHTISSKFKKLEK